MAYINTKRIERLIKLDKTVISEIKDDKSAMQEAFITMMVAAVVGRIWDIIASMGFALIFILVGTPIGWVIATGIFQILAKLFGGKGKFEDYLKLSAYTGAPAILGIIPLIGTIIGRILVLVNFYRATKEVHQLTTGKTILVLIIPALILAALLVALILFVGFSMKNIANSY